MIWLKWIPTLVTTLYEVYKILRDLKKQGVDIKTCTVEIKPGEVCK